MPHTFDQTVCSPSSQSFRLSSNGKQVDYTFSKDEMFIKRLEKLDKIELKELLRFHRGGALNAGRELAAVFTAAAAGFSDDLDDHDSISSSDGDSTFNDSEEDSTPSTKDDSSIDEEESDISSEDYEYQHISETYDDDDSPSPSEEADDSTFVEDDSEVESSYSTVDRDVQMLVEDFHELMRKILEHNSAACLIQFVLNKQIGREYDGPSLVRAMLPWTFNLGNRRHEAEILVELDK